MMSYLKFTLVLASVVWATGSVQALDVVVVTRNRIHLFPDGIGNTTTDVRIENTSFFAAAYDPIKKDVYVSGTGRKTGSIFRIKTTGKTEYNVTELVVAKQDEPVYKIAFDHLNSTLYWTSYKSIFYVRVPDNVTTVPLTGHVLLKLDVEFPDGITIDVHRGYLYWTSRVLFKATIERSRLDGSDRQVVVQDDLNNLQGITVDVESNTLYWLDWHENGYRSLHSMELRDNGTRHTLVNATGKLNPYAIALSERNVYWLDLVSDELWMMPKNSSRHNVSPTLVSKINFSGSLKGIFVLSDVDVVSSAGSKDMPLDFKIFTILVPITITINYIIN